MASSIREINHGKLAIPLIVSLLGMVSFSCCVGAELKKLKVKDMKLDGSLCSLPRSAAFGLGIAAIACLFVALIAGTSASGTALCTRGHKSGRRNGALAVALLILSWVSFGMVAVIVGTGSSMNGGQRYGRGWLDGRCYVVKDGLYAGAAVLVAATVGFILGFTFTLGSRIPSRRTGPEVVEGGVSDKQVKERADWIGFVWWLGIR